MDEELQAEATPKEADGRKEFCAGVWSYPLDSLQYSYRPTIDEVNCLRERSTRTPLADVVD